MSTKAMLNPLRRSQSAHRQEMLRFFRDRRNPNTTMGRVCIAAHAKLVELQKDSRRTHGQKQAIFQRLIDEVKVNLWAEQERQKFVAALDAETEKPVHDAGCASYHTPAFTPVQTPCDCSLAAKTPAPIGVIRRGPDIPLK